MDLDLNELVWRRPGNGKGVEIRKPFQFDNPNYHFDGADSFDVGWRLCVETAVPSTGGAVWGTARWGQDRWSQIDWVDVTEDVRDIRITRGGAPDALMRSDMGTMEVVLDNNSKRYTKSSPSRYAPSAYMGASVLIRVSVFKPAPDDIYTYTTWYPLATMFIDSWTPRHEGATATGVADRWVTVTAVDTISWLNRVDEFATDPEVGAGEDIEARVDRLTSGFAIDALTAVMPGGDEYPYTFQSTAMAGNRLTELQLVADSADADFRSDKRGVPVMTDKDEAALWTYGFGNLIRLGLYNGYKDGGFWVIDYDADSLTVIDDDEIIINEVNLACANGTEQPPFVDTVSVDHHQTRSHTRNGLIYSVSDQVAAGAYLGNKILARGTVDSYRPEGLTLTVRSGDHLWYVANLDLFQPITIETPDETFYDYSIANYTHTIVLHSGTFEWITDITFGVTETSNWEAVDA